MVLAEDCLGHQERENRRNKILAKRPKVTLDENLRVPIKGKGAKGQSSWSLRELEDDYKSKTEWKVIEDGGVLSIPVEESWRQTNERIPRRCVTKKT